MGTASSSCPSSSRSLVASPAFSTPSTAVLGGHGDSEGVLAGYAPNVCSLTPPPSPGATSSHIHPSHGSTTPAALEGPSNRPVEPRHLSGPSQRHARLLRPHTVFWLTHPPPALSHLTTILFTGPQGKLTPSGYPLAVKTEKLACF